MLKLLLLRLSLLAARLMPFAAAAALGERAFRLFSRWHPARGVIEENLKIVALAGGRDDVTCADVFAAYGRYWGEFLSLSASPARIADLKIRVEGAENLRGHESICGLTAHLGNWDLAARWVSLHVSDFSVVAEPLKPPLLFRLFVRMRERGGTPVIPAGGEGWRIYRHLKQGGSIGLVNDRVFGAGERKVRFLGGQRSLPTSGMNLAHKAGATLIPIFMLREGSTFAIKVHPPLAASEDPVLGFARVLEEEVKARPEQWCLLYPALDAEIGLSKGASAH